MPCARSADSTLISCGSIDNARHGHGPTRTDIGRIDRNAPQTRFARPPHQHAWQPHRAPYRCRDQRSDQPPAAAPAPELSAVFLAMSQGLRVRGLKLEGRRHHAVIIMVVLRRSPRRLRAGRAAGGACAPPARVDSGAPSGTGRPWWRCWPLIRYRTRGKEPVGSPVCQRSVDALTPTRAHRGRTRTAPCVRSQAALGPHVLQHFRRRELAGLETLDQVDGAEIVQRLDRFLGGRFMHGHRPEDGFR